MMTVTKGLGQWPWPQPMLRHPKSGKTSSNQKLSEVKDVRYMVPLNIRQSSNFRLELTASFLLTNGHCVISLFNHLLYSLRREISSFDG